MAEQKSQELITLETKRTELLTSIKTFEIKTPEDAVIAKDAQIRLRAFQKVVEAARKSVVDPLNAKLHEVNNYFKAEFLKVNESEIAITRNIVKWDTAVIMQQRAAQAELDRKAEQKFEKQIAKGQVPAIPEPVAPLVAAAPKTIDTDAGKHTARMAWKWRYAEGRDSNPATTRIPPQYHLINEVMLNGIARSTKGTLQIPGVVFFEEAESSTRYFNQG